MTMMDWDAVQIEDLGDIIAGGTPSRGIPSYWNGCIPWVTPSEITELRDKYLRETRERITAEGLAGSAAKLLPPGSILVTRRATLGEAALAAVPVATNQGFKSIIPNADSHSLFTYYLIRSLKLEMERLASGTTFLEISKADFSRIKVRRPKPDEQARIAAVLDTVDEAIAKTEAVIAKLKHVRAGLLHDLLTRGLDEHGQLRDPIVHPEQFKDSPLGHIPCEWEVVTVESIGSTKRHAIVDGPFGSNLKTIHYRDNGIPVIQSGYVTSGEFLADSYVYVDQDLFEEQRRSAVEPGDIVMAKIGAQCGTCAIVPDGLPIGILAGNSLKISTNNNLCRVAFLLEILHYYYALGIIDRIKSETAQPAISLKHLRAMLIPRPSLQEQDAIISCLACNKDMLKTEKANLSKLQQLKCGLMADLLTGRVRVPESISVVEKQS